MKNKAAVLLALVMVCLPAACGNAASNADSRSTGSNANNSNTNNSNVSTQTYTDVSVVKEIFPGLDGISDQIEETSGDHGSLSPYQIPSRTQESHHRHLSHAPDRYLAHTDRSKALFG